MSTRKKFSVICLLLAAALLASQCGPSDAAAATPAGTKKAETFLDVGKHPPITMLINQSPWYRGFEQVAKLYETQTGNVLKLDVTPYAGMLEKTRNAVRDKESPYDLVNIDTQNTVELYEGGFLTPITEIDPAFRLDPNVLTMEDSIYWNPKTKWRQATGGTLMGLPISGNLLVLYYRADLYEQAGLKPPATWDDIIAACDKYHKPPNMYCFIQRGERGNGIRYNWMPFMLGYGTNVEKDPANGDFRVTVNSPEGKKALDLFIDIAKKYSPPNVGTIGQADIIQYLTTGKAVHAILVLAAWSSMDDPDKSAVVGKINITVPPKPVGGVHASPWGTWVGGIPKNLPAKRKQATLAFLKWFSTAEAQRKYAELGAVPVRKDILEGELATRKELRWMKGYRDTIPWAKQVLAYTEGAQVEQVLGLRLNQALIGEMSSAKALNLAAEEIYQIFLANGRKTGVLSKLPE